MTSQMVSRFRVKKLSPKHPLPVYKESQLPDLTDPANLQRSVPQIETGVEKEEEEEHDLQAAISAAQAAVTTGAQVERYIPTPDASRTIETKDYIALYPKKFKEPYTLIRFSSTVEDCVGCPYYMDKQDDTFLNQLNKTLKSRSITEEHFEKIMWELESITNQQLPHLSLDPSQIPDFDAFQSLIPPQSTLLSEPGIDDIFEHWRSRRSKRAGKPIIPVLQYEDLVKNEVDPYVCFRRRETKSVRKTRRTDQQSMERLRRLRNEMEMARNLLEMVLKREKLRKEGLVLEHAVFDKKCKFREYQRTLGIKEDEELFATTSPKKRRKASSGELGSGTTIKIPLNKLKRNGFDARSEKTPMQLAIETELLRKKEQDAPYEDVTESSYQPFPKPVPDLFYKSLYPSHPITQKHPLYRKRLGRNGRLFLDRTGYHPSRSSSSSPGGKLDPVDTQVKTNQRYRFDTDYSTEDDDDDDNDGDHFMDMNVMHERSLHYRSQLLTESDLRNLTTIPFLTPLNTMNSHKTSGHPSTSTTSQQSSAQQQSSSSSTPTYLPQVTSIGSSSPSAVPTMTATPATTSITTTTETPLEAGSSIPSPSASTSPHLNHNGDSSPGMISSVAIKRQNSRNKMTPQQAAVAMANGMIVANMAAAVNHNGQAKTAMQMAMEAAQHKRKHQQQHMVSSSNMGQSAVGTFSHP